MSLSVSNASSNSDIYAAGVDGANNIQKEEINGSNALERIPGADLFERVMPNVTTFNTMFYTKISGKADNVEFDLKKEGLNNLFNPLMQYKGNINGEEANFTISPTMTIFTPETIKGKVGNKEVDLSVSKKLTGAVITGTFNGEEINLRFDRRFRGYCLSGENTNYKVARSVFENLNTSGEFGYDSELLPVLITYANRSVQADIANEHAAMYTYYT